MRAAGVLTRREFAGVAAGGAAAARARGQHSAALAQGFAEPPFEARPSTYWVWLNGYTERARLSFELEELKKKGFGAVYILEIGARPAGAVPAGPAYMGPESLEAISHAVREAMRLGLEVGITNASSWNSGGAWVEPEHAGKRLYWSRVDVAGPRVFSEALPMPELPREAPRKPDGSPAYYAEVAVLGVPEPAPEASAIIDLTDRLDR